MRTSPPLVHRPPVRPPRRLCRVGLPVVTAGLVGCGDPQPKGSTDGWATENQDLGAPLRSGPPTAALPDADALWFVLAQHLPGLDFDDPAVDLPLSLWALALQDQIADEGSCPYRDLTDRGERWSSDCRSQDGYQWQGGVEAAAWTDAGLRWSRTDFDLEITADTDERSFDHLRLRGAVVFVSPDSVDPSGAPEGFEHGTQANVEVELAGFWAQADPADPREPAWNGWAVTGRTEARAGGTRVESTVALGGLGQLDLGADAMTPETDCGAVPGGDARIEAADATAALRFDPDGACAPCADVVLDGEVRARACAN